MAGTRPYPLMKCGHVAQGIDNKTGKPVCVICIGLNDGADKPVDETPSFEGRKARCFYCKQVVPSHMTLPFFEYKPKEVFDEYYCGCHGWD